MSDTPETEPTAFSILAEWAWAKVQLEREQTEENIHAYQRALRRKKALERANPDTPETKDAV